MGLKGPSHNSRLIDRFQVTTFNISLRITTQCSTIATVFPICHLFGDTISQWMIVISWIAGCQGASAAKGPPHTITFYGLCPKIITQAYKLGIRCFTSHPLKETRIMIIHKRSTLLNPPVNDSAQPFSRQPSSANLVYNPAQG